MDAKSSFLSFFDMLIMLFILGSDMKTLKKILFPGPKAEAASTLIDGRLPSSVAQDESIGHIVMTRHTGIFYVVLPTGQIFPFGSEEEMWLFYVKATYVYTCKYNSTAHETVAVLIEHILNVPSILKSAIPKTAPRLLTILLKPNSKRKAKNSAADS